MIECSGWKESTATDPHCLRRYMLRLDLPLMTVVLVLILFEG
jgi:hypothetical protein